MLTGSGDDVEVIGDTPGYEGLHAWRSTVHGHEEGVLRLDFGWNCTPTCVVVSSCSIAVLGVEPL